MDIKVAYKQLHEPSFQQGYHTFLSDTTALMNQWVMSNGDHSHDFWPPIPRVVNLTPLRQFLIMNHWFMKVSSIKYLKDFSPSLKDLSTRKLSTDVT